MALLFEFQNCSRCGGSGHYSYCQMYGTTCFLCKGKKQILTKRGRAAQALYTRLLSKPLSQIQVGEQISELGMTAGGQFYSAWWIVESIRKDELNPGYVIQAARVKQNGEQTEDRCSFGGVYLDKLYRVRCTDPLRLRNVVAIATAYQSILSKSGKEPKWWRTIAWG